MRRTRGAAGEHPRRVAARADRLVPEHGRGGSGRRIGPRRRRASAAGTVGWYAAAAAALGPRVRPGRDGRRAGRLAAWRVHGSASPFDGRIESWCPMCGDGRARRSRAAALLFTRPSRSAGVPFPAWSPHDANPPRAPGGRAAARDRRSTATRGREILAAADRAVRRARGRRARRWPRSPAAAGLQQSSLYYYFRNKGELLDEIVARGQPGAARARRPGPRGRRVARGAALPDHPGRRGGLVRLAVRPQRDPPPRRPRPRTRSPATGPSVSSWSTSWPRS